MKYKVNLTRFAQTDLLMIGEYYLSKVGAGHALNILMDIETAIESLKNQPQRGHRLHELYQIPSLNQLEIIVDRYRIIYQIQDSNVYIIAIFDCRQDVKSHLLKRMSILH